MFVVLNIEANFYEMPGDIGFSQLHVKSGKNKQLKRVAWMTGGGVSLYELDIASLDKFSSMNVSGSGSALAAKHLITQSNQEIISYPQAKEHEHQFHLQSAHDSQEYPIGVCLTEFHLAMFYKARVRIVCILNKECVLNQKFDLKVSFTTKTLRQSSIVVNICACR